MTEAIGIACAVKRMSGRNVTENYFVERAVSLVPAIVCSVQLASLGACEKY